MTIDIFFIHRRQCSGAPGYSVGWGDSRYRDREWLRARIRANSLLLHRTKEWVL